MVYQPLASGHYQQALDLLSMVTSRIRMLPPQQRSMIRMMEALATAGLGDTDETQRLIAFAEDYFDAPQDERDREWNLEGWYNHAECYGLAGHALTTLAMHNPLNGERCARPGCGLDPSTSNGRSPNKSTGAKHSRPLVRHTWRP
jgi:hypothetical protein